MVAIEQQSRRDVAAFAALTAFAVVMYAVPGEWIPGAAALRLALVTSGLAAGLMALRRLGKLEPLFFDGLRGLAMLAFVLVGAASVSWAVHPEEAQSNAIELVKLAAIYLTIVNVVTSAKRLVIVCSAMVLASVVTAIGSIEWYLAGVDLVEGYRARWVGVFADPNRLAMSIGIVVPIAVAILARKQSGWVMRVLAAAAAALAVVSIVVTHSRGGFIGLTVAMAIWAFREKRRVQAIFVGAALFVGLLVFAPKSFWARNETVTDFREDASAMGRVHAWTVTSRINIDKPLLGVGLGSFRYAWPIYAPPEAAARAYVAHNVFLEVLGELGFVGLLLFLLFAGGASGGAFAASNDPDVGWLARALGASVAGYLVCNLFAGDLVSPHLFVLFGLAASAQRVASLAKATDGARATQVVPRMVEA